MCCMSGKARKGLQRALPPVSSATMAMTHTSPCDRGSWVLSPGLLLTPKVTRKKLIVSFVSQLRSICKAFEDLHIVC